MAELNRKAVFLAQLIKEAGRIEGEKKLAKMLCYIGTERGIDTGFKFDKNHEHGHYTFEIKEETRVLQKEGLVEFVEEQDRGCWGDKITTHIFIATPKLKAEDLPLAENEKRAVHSIYREYSPFCGREIEQYDHEVYRHGKTRTDVEFRKYALEKTEKLIEKHKGNRKAAFEEWLFS
jgi:hypothetical protein